MNYAMADGGGGGRVEISIARIKEIATSTMATMHDDATTHSRSFRNTKLTDGAFGQVPQALQFSAQQDAAHAVFLDTIAAILAELETFRSNLIASANAHQANDEAVESTMAAMNHRYGQGHAWSAETTYDHERTDNRALDVSATPDAQPPADGQPAAGAAPATPPAAPTPPSDPGSSSSFGGGAAPSGPGTP